MTFPAKETIQKRKSVRSFDGRPLAAEERDALESYFQDAVNPFGVPVEFRLLDVEKYGLSSPVIVGADTYVAAKALRRDNYEVGYGYSFESFCLYATSIGLGTVMLAASLNRKAFERAMEVRDDEVMPVASPVGHPAAKRSIRESLMRKGLKADERIAFERLFFAGTYGQGLKKEDAGAFSGALEMARWAPSATNRQPWRAIVDGDAVHFFEEQTLKDSPLGDIQKVDLGIALAHFDLTLKEEGIRGSFVQANPGCALPEGVHYIASFERGA